MNSSQPDMQPVVRVAPPAELKAYVVLEHQLDLLAQGSPTSLMLNFGLFFLGTAATAAGTLVAIPDDPKVYVTFLVLFLVTLIAGVVTVSLWFVMRGPIKKLIQEIKSQMPPNPAIQSESTSSLPS